MKLDLYRKKLDTCVTYNVELMSKGARGSGMYLFSLKAH